MMLPYRGKPCQEQLVANGTGLRTFGLQLSNALECLLGRLLFLFLFFHVYGGRGVKNPTQDLMH